MIYRYYALGGPISTASVPKGFINHHSFAQGRMYIPTIDEWAYGYVDYDHPVQLVDRQKYKLKEEFLDPAQREEYEAAERRVMSLNLKRTAPKGWAQV